MARSASTTAYAATMAELATYANGAYVPNYFTGTPAMDGAGAPGTAAFVSRGDHVHPSDTSRVAKGDPLHLAAPLMDARCGRLRHDVVARRPCASDQHSAAALVATR